MVSEREKPHFLQIIQAKHTNSKVNKTTEMVPQEAQRQGVTEELGTITHLNLDLDLDLGLDLDL